MKYIRVSKYIICLDGIHGVLNHEFQSNPAPDGKSVTKYQIIVHYIAKPEAFLDFPSKEDADKSFEKIASILESL